ncbi:HEAT repeat domain-containing protein [Alicyclobacillus tolerans]|uniref:HEAT repeat domain-containing protein n=1 Tax=Alicyclobacillus tolerans TaxID=90970 RepID=UPI003B7B01B4
MDTSNIQYLIDLIEKGPQFQRPKAVKRLGEVGTNSELEIIRPLLSDNDWHVRSAASYALVKILGKDAILEIEPLLNDRAYGVRQDVKALLDELTSELKGVNSEN